MASIKENLDTPIAGEYDVIVVGGGPAGIPAAVAAARMGARTLVLEVNSCLGGVWTAGILTWVFDMEKTGIGKELIDRLKEKSGCVEANSRNMVNFTYDVETMKVLLEDMCAENKIDFLLQTRVVAARVDSSGRVAGVVTESKSGRQAWLGKVFIDASGDGDLGAQAGCRFDFGSGETKEIQPLTYMATIVVPDHAPLEEFISFYNGVPEHRERTLAFKKYLADIGVDPSYAVPTLFQIKGNLLALMVNHQYNVVSFNARQMTDATVAARKEVNLLVDALRGSAGPFRGTILASTAEHIGVREGRRIHGRYSVTVDDLTSGARFEDAVCRVRFGIDIHATSKKNREWDKQNYGRGLKSIPYDIPLRALIAKDVDGLLMAGRCISGDWYAHASYRVTGEAVSMGEAAGALAAYSAKTGSLPHAVPWKDIQPHIPEVRDSWT